MNLKQNEVSLNWTRPDQEIFSTNLMLSYRLFYTTSDSCAVSECEAERCRVQTRIRSRFESVTFSQELFPFTNYTWQLELTYTNNRSLVQHHSVSVDVQTSQSGEQHTIILKSHDLFTVCFVTCSAASAPVNLTVLNESFQWVNLTWGRPQCPNGIISHYRVCCNVDS